MLMAGGVDRRRPELAPFRPVLERLRAGGARYFGVPAPTLRVERYMPRFYSDVVKLAVAGGQRSISAYVKIAKLRTGDTPETMAHHVVAVFDTMTELHRTMAGVPGLSAVRPIACFPEHLAIVTEEAPGEMLLGLLEAKAVWWPAAEAIDQLALSLQRVGEWLRRFHEVAPASSGQLSVAEMREYLDVRLRILVDKGRGRFSASTRRKLLAAFDARAAHLSGEDLRLVPIHADFAPGNIVVDGGSVAVLDFSVPAYGAACHDVTHLHMQLGLLTAKPQFRPRTIGALQKALLRGFDRTMDPSRPPFELLSLQHVVCHFTGLAQNPAPRSARAYNWYLMQRHARWIDRFVRKAGVR
jgi:hypothetical protein